MPNSEARGKESERGLVLALKTTSVNRRELLLTLEEFRSRVLSEPGCTGCQVLENTTDINHLVWTEWWIDQAYADLAIERPRFRALIGAIKLLGAIEDQDWVGRRDGPALWNSDRRGANGRGSPGSGKPPTKASEN
jgi:quinol monooxygenase YgiN